MAIDVNKSFSIDNGLSFNDSVYIFEGEEDPSVALASSDVVTGSVYINYSNGINLGMYQKTQHSPLTYVKFGEGGSPSEDLHIDGGFANSVYLNTQVIDGGNALG